MIRVIVFGTGSSASSFLGNVGSHVHVLACLDNDPDRQGTEWNGIPVKSPADISNIQFDYVVIASQYVIPIRKQLIELGVLPDIILPLYPLQLTQSLLDDYKQALNMLYDNRQDSSGKRRIQLISSNRSGCNARALYDYAPPTIMERYEVRLVTEAEVDAGEADCVVTTHRNRTLSGSGVNIELWHGFPLKAMGRMNAASLEDRASGENWLEAHGIASYSPLYTTLMNACFPTTADKFEVTGLPRNDRLFRSQGRELLQSLLPVSIQGKKIVLYMPTFRLYKSRGYTEGVRDWDNVFGIQQFNSGMFESFLKRHDILLLLKLHPFEESEWLQRMEHSQHIRFITEEMLAGHELDMYDLLNAADILITDYSSVYFDYLLLDRPVVFTPTDLEQYRKTRGFLLEPYEWWTAGDKALSQTELEESLLSGLAEPQKHAEKRQEICRLVHEYQDGHSAERVWDMIEGRMALRGIMHEKKS